MTTTQKDYRFSPDERRFLDVIGVSTWEPHEDGTVQIGDDQVMYDDPAPTVEQVRHAIRYVLHVQKRLADLGKKPLDDWEQFHSFLMGLDDSGMYR